MPASTRQGRSEVRPAIARLLTAPEHAAIHPTHPPQLKLPGIERTTSSASSRGSSPARWKPAAPGCLSPLNGLAGTSPAPPAGSSSMLRLSLSARGGAGGLQESEAGALVGSPAAQHSLLLSSSPVLELKPQSWGVAGGGSNSSGLGPRGPSGSGGGSFTPHLLNGFVRDASSSSVESPSRPRRASSAPGNQLHLLAVQHSAQQVVAGASGSGVGGFEGPGSSSNSPRPYGSAAVAGAYTSAGRPSTLNLAFLDEGSPGPGLLPSSSSAVPTPASCDTPGSDPGVASPHSLVRLAVWVVARRLDCLPCAGHRACAPPLTAACCHCDCRTVPGVCVVYAGVAALHGVAPGLEAAAATQQQRRQRQQHAAEHQRPRQQHQHGGGGHGRAAPAAQRQKGRQAVRSSRRNAWRLRARGGRRGDAWRSSSSRAASAAAAADA